MDTELMTSVVFEQRLGKAIYREFNNQPTFENGSNLVSELVEEFIRLHIVPRNLDILIRQPDQSEKVLLVENYFND